MKQWSRVVMSWSLLMVVAATAAEAQIEWTNPAGGSFNDAQNWNPAVVPTGEDSILFDLPAGYLVTGDFAFVAATTVRRSDVGFLFLYEGGGKGRGGEGGYIDFGDLTVGGFDLDLPGSLRLRGGTDGNSNGASIGAGAIASRLILDPKVTFDTNTLALRDAASIDFRVSAETPADFQYTSMLRIYESGSKLDGSIVVGVAAGEPAPILGSEIGLIRLSGSFLGSDDFPFTVVRPPALRTFSLFVQGDKGGESIRALYTPSDTVASISLSQSDDLGAPPTRLVTADLDGNGRDDLVVLVDSGIVRVYRSLANGTFEPPTEYSVCSSPVDASSGDFDGDGTIDLAIGCAGDSTLQYLLNPDGDPSMLVDGPSIVVDGEIRSLAATSFPTTNFASVSGTSLTLRDSGGRGRTKGYTTDGTNVIEVADVEVGDEPGPSDPVDDEGKKDPEEPIGVGGVQSTGFGTGNPILTLLRPIEESPGFETAGIFPLSGVAVDFASGDLDGDSLGEILVVTENGHLDLLRATRPDIPVRAIHLGGTPTSIAIGEIADGGGPEIVIGLADPSRVEIYRQVPDFGANLAGDSVPRIVLERYAVQFLGEAPTDVTVTTVQDSIDDSEVIIGLPGGGGAPSVNITEVEIAEVPACTFSDFNSDGEVNAFDLAFILGYWGPCPSPSAPCAAFDLNEDGQVDATDLGILFSDWGACE